MDKQQIVWFLIHSLADDSIGVIVTLTFMNVRAKCNAGHDD